MTSTTTIRVTTETRDRLNDLARQRGTSAGDLIAELVREADDQALLAHAESSWKAVGRDARLLGCYRAESGRLSDFDSSLPEY